MKPKFFPTQEDFRDWLRENHEHKKELIVGYYKKGTGRPSITWPESVDQALCFGWIDGIRRKVDEDSYCIRFTPRRPDSNWSAVNLKKVEALKKAGLMRKAGLEAYERRRESKSEVYGYERKARKLSKEYLAQFRDHTDAWEYFRKQTPYVKKTSENWVMSAKMEKTRERRLGKLIEACEKKEKLM